MRNTLGQTSKENDILTFTKYMDTILETGMNSKYKPFELMDIYSLAPYIIVLDVEPDDRFKYRFIGTQLVSIYGDDCTGQYLNDVNLGVNSHKVLTALCDIKNSKKPQRMQTSISVSNRHELSASNYSIEYDRVAYPIADDNGDITQIVSLIMYENYAYHDDKELKLNVLAS